MPIHMVYKTEYIDEHRRAIDYRLNKQGYRTYRRNYLRLTWVPGSKYFWHIKAKCSWRIPTDPFEVLPKFVKEFRLEKIDGFEALQGFLLLL